MAERKVLTKYYPPDFDPSKLEKRKKGPKQVGPKQQVVRLMAPFSMKCTSCGEYIYKGRKFNARKETTEEKYLSITIFRFYIRCTRCSSEITFRTDPKGMDYECERGARRNFEMWRQPGVQQVETEEEMLERVRQQEEERDPMKELEQKTHDAKREMEIADKLDEIRTANAQRERVGREGAGVVMVRDSRDEEREAIERELEEQAKMAFTSGTGEVVRRCWNDEELTGENGDGGSHASAVPSFQRQKKTKKDFASSLGIKKATVANEQADSTKTAPVTTVKAAPAPAAAPKASLMVDYGSDDDDD
ncbi:hypothetical protein MBLNU230_g0578t1 [Neophaeotheca triangularis]